MKSIISDDELKIVQVQNPRGIHRPGRPDIIKIGGCEFLRIDLLTLPQLSQEIQTLVILQKADLLANPARGDAFCTALLKNAPEIIDEPGSVFIQPDHANGMLTYGMQLHEQLPVAVTVKKEIALAKAWETIRLCSN